MTKPKKKLPYEKPRLTEVGPDHPMVSELSHPKAPQANTQANTQLNPEQEKSSSERMLSDLQNLDVRRVSCLVISLGINPMLSAPVTTPPLGVPVKTWFKMLTAWVYFMENDHQVAWNFFITKERRDHRKELAAMQTLFREHGFSLTVGVASRFFKHLEYLSKKAVDGNSTMNEETIYTRCWLYALQYQLYVGQTLNHS